MILEGIKTNRQEHALSRARPPDRNQSIGSFGIERILRELAVEAPKSSTRFRYVLYDVNSSGTKGVSNTVARYRRANGRTAVRRSGSITPRGDENIGTAPLVSFADCAVLEGRAAVPADVLTA